MAEPLAGGPMEKNMLTAAVAQDAQKRPSVAISKTRAVVPLCLSSLSLVPHAMHAVSVWVITELQVLQRCMPCPHPILRPGGL